MEVMIEHGQLFRKQFELLLFLWWRPTMTFEACLASHSRVVSQSQAVYGCPNILDFGILNTSGPS